MKKTIKLALSASLLLGATSSFATNGTNLIGFGAKSRAMGGTAISNFNGAESAFANPALISKSKATTETTIGATLLMPDVSFEAAPYGVSESSSTSGDGMIPSVAVINKVDDSLSWAMALYGVGGMGVDYRDESNMLSNTNDNLMLMRMSIPIAYTIEGVSIGIAPVIEYGSLAISSMDGTNPSGVTTDIATGFELGAAYEIAGVSLGLDYKSAVTHDFKNTFASGASGNSKLDTPAVLGLGVSYSMDEHTVALDYKSIAYSSAKGFDDFGWEDQDVIAIGYEYTTKTWGARIGYNYGKSPLPTDTVTNAATSTSLGSMMMFPAVTETHITFGGSYSLNKTMSVDLAYMIASGSQTIDLAANSGGLGTPAGEATATNDQTALSFAVNYAY